jgi:hypothetical protein
MSFTDQKPRIATEDDLKARWSGGKPGEYFRCNLWGYHFKLGDHWRWVYAGHVHLQNLTVCHNCDGPNDQVLEKWKKANEELKTHFWWAIRQYE